MDHLLEYEDFNLNESMDSDFNRLVSEVKKDGILTVGKPFKNKDGDKTIELKFPKDFNEVTGEYKDEINYPFYLIANKYLGHLILTDKKDGYEDYYPNPEDLSDVYYLTSNSNIMSYNSFLMNKKKINN